jgi:hypothetical protein
MKSRIRIATNLTAFLLFSVGGCFASVAQADLIVSLPSGPIQAGRAGTFDVLVSPSGVSDGFNLFQVRLQVIPVSATEGTSLGFVNPQDERFVTNPDYVFFGNSENQINGIPLSNVSTTATLRDTIQFDDTTADNGDRVVDEPALLFSFQIEHLVPVGSDLNALNGDTFEIRATFLDFENQFFEGVAATSTSGLFTITAVPEPSFGLSIALAVGGLAYRRRDRRARCMTMHSNAFK